ncbi:MAG: hypothetical protein RIS09_504 [Actinomycetota bacterium]|jgi:hypothetical protein
MKTKLRALVGGVALLLVLAACYPGINSQLSQGYELQATITKGKVNLNHSVFGADGFIEPDGLQGPFSFNRVTNAGNGTATVDLNFSVNRGNWSVTGKWIDGPVRMEFAGKSEYLSALLAHCLSTVDVWDYDSGLIGRPNIDDEWYPYNNGEDQWFGGSCFNAGVAPAPGYVENIQYGTWVKGGCTFIPTLYRSLNSQLVGTGHALILVCQNGGQDNPVTMSWENPSYIEVWIPDTTNIDREAIGDINIYMESNEQYILDYPEFYLDIDFEDNVYYGRDYFETDNSPFRNYFAGGVNTNRSGKWIVQTRFNNLANSPLPTEAPLFSQYWW